jgi:hypothetical protein
MGIRERIKKVRGTEKKTNKEVLDKLARRVIVEEE